MVLDAAKKRKSMPDHILLCGPAGTGKCLGKGTPVLLFDGRIVPVEDIQVGDSLMGPDSKPRQVLTLGRGVGKLYKIIPIKGEPWVCNENHILTVSGEYGGIIDIELTEAIKHISRRKINRLKLIRSSIDFPKKSLPFDPYLIGVWLGDGSKHGGNPRITNADPEIHNYCVQTAQEMGMKCNLIRDERNNTYTISFCKCKKTRGKSHFQIFTEFLLDNNDKFIPFEYLTSSREQRLALLAGLIDTDGYLTSGCYDYITESKRLCDGILFLARSVGLAAYSNKVIKSIKSTGYSGEYYRISISGDTNIIPCLVARRKAGERKQIKRATVTSFSVEPAGIGDYYGFTLDGDGRFLLGDFTVTHNTSLVRIIVREHGGEFAEFAGGLISSKEDIFLLIELIRSKKKLFVFIDEIHRLPKKFAECLYSVIQDFTFQNEQMEKFTLIGASTTIGKLPKPLRDRFKHVYTLDFYSLEEISILVNNIIPGLNKDVIREIAIRSHGVPRIARNLLTEVLNTSLVLGNGKPTMKDADRTFGRLCIDKLGLGTIDRSIMHFIFVNSKASENTLCNVFELGKEDLHELHESNLIRLGLITKSQRGRILTDRGAEYALSMKRS